MSTTRDFAVAVSNVKCFLAQEPRDPQLVTPREAFEIFAEWGMNVARTERTAWIDAVLCDPAQFLAMWDEAFDTAKFEEKPVASRTKRVQLQGIGRFDSIPAGELQPGMRMVWNYDYTSTVLTVERTSPQTITTTQRSDKEGTTHTRKFRTTRAVVAYWPQERKQA